MRREHEQQRLDTAITELGASRERLLAAIRQVHPQDDCLPVPPLELPVDRASFDEIIRAICDNLLTPHPRYQNAPRWLDAHQNCRHLATATAVDINDLIYRWYQLLIAARKHVDDGPETAYDLAWTSERLDKLTATMLATAQCRTATASHRLPTPHVPAD
jgi:hypothetical protein